MILFFCLTILFSLIMKMHIMLLIILNEIMKIHVSLIKYQKNVIFTPGMNWYSVNIIRFLAWDSLLWNHECSVKSYFILLHSSTAYSHIIHQTYTKVRRPPLPDYQSATQMAQLARQKHYWQMERSHSHEGVVGYCNGQAPYYRVSDDGRSPHSSPSISPPTLGC